MLQLKAPDSITNFQQTFAFVWNHLEVFDLDGHNLGTIQFNFGLYFLNRPFCCQKHHFKTQKWYYF